MENQRIEELRKQYMQNPPEGMDVSDIQNMSDDDLTALIDMAERIKK